MIFAWLKRRRRRALLETPLPATWIGHLERGFALWAWLDDDERRRLLDITRILVAEKDWEGGGGLEVTEEMQVVIAAQAALLLLGLEHTYFHNVQTIVVYPESYRLPRSNRASPYLAEEHVPVLGHARMNGGVVLSWRSALMGGKSATDGHNLVYHEFAHKLDMKDGVIDGTPFLPKRLLGGRWFSVMSKEFKRLKRQKASGRSQVLDFYGATDVAEFFAVATESFFEEPLKLEEKNPELYGVLKDYYHQDPAARLARRRRVSS
jgi:Mlc titration factor MtfA (ptsG expression regulator)